MCYFPKIHNLVILTCFLIFLGAVCRYLSTLSNIPSLSVCPDNGWRIGDLKIQTGLKYAQPSTQRGYIHFLKGLLESGEKYFLIDFRVTYYIFTDQEEDVSRITSQIKMGRGRKTSVVTIPSASRWQDVVLGRMKWATITIEKQIRDEADYAFMMDVDSVFYDRFGAESLSQLTAVLHRGYYKDTKRDQFPYERRPTSKAFIPYDEGDYYYTAAMLGGYLEDMYKLVKHCYMQSLEDEKNKIEAVWQEESHLNKYLLYNKPTKVLSPEYLWSDYDEEPDDIQVVRLSQLIKNYKEVRPNGGQ